MLFHENECDCGPCVRHRRNQGTANLAKKIALTGGRAHPEKQVYEADWSPYCDTPVALTRYITSRDAKDGLRAMEVYARVPCRKCSRCLQFRQNRWRERAEVEMIVTAASQRRTWFITLTFSPTHLAGVLLESYGEKNGSIEAAAYRHVQKFLKRMRKGGSRFRYLAVFERGEETGRAHYHLLVHETGDKPVMKDQIEAEWRSGFSYARLVSGSLGRTAAYVTKYTTKSMDIRPRASHRYGHIPLPHQLVGGVS